MDHIRELVRAIGGTFMVPSTIFSALIAVPIFFREEFGLKFIPEVSPWIVLACAVIPPMVWAFWGLLNNATTMRRELDHLRNAWDRTDRNLIPIRDAIELVARNLSDTWSGAKDDATRHKKAGAKLREIGKENQIPIWGTQYIEDGEEFQDHKEQIPPFYWNKSRINVGAVMNGLANENDLTIQTEGDPAYADDVEAPAQYGGLMINRTMLEAACPPGRA